MARGTGEITIRERVTFASGDFFVGGGASLLSVLYLIFLTDVVKLAPGLAGTAVLVAKLWDAVNDPLVGNISDRVRTRWGRRRPFIIVGALLLVPVMALFWWPTPPPTSQIGLAAWAALTYIAYNSVQTVVGARRPVNTRPMPPWRSTSRSLMLSAPTTRPAMIADTLVGVFAPAVPGTVTCSATRSYRPACSARDITAGNPPKAIRFGSSKTGSRV